MMTSKRKLTDETFHPSINHGSCRVIICLMGFADVFFYSPFHWKGASENTGAIKAKTCPRASVSTAGDRALAIRYTASQLRHSAGSVKLQAMQSDHEPAPVPFTSPWPGSPSASKTLSHRPNSCLAWMGQKELHDTTGGRPRTAKGP